MRRRHLRIRIKLLENRAERREKTGTDQQAEQKTPVGVIVMAGLSNLHDEI